MAAVSLSIQSEAEAVRWACLAVRGILEGVDLSDDDKFLVELAMSEAASNVLRHAYDNQPGKKIAIEVTVEDDHLVVTMTDTGIPLSQERIEVADLPSEESPQEDLGGRGLFLMKTGMDEVVVERVGESNVLTMTKRHGGKK